MKKEINNKISNEVRNAMIEMEGTIENILSREIRENIIIQIRFEFKTSLQTELKTLDQRINHEIRSMNSDIDEKISNFELNINNKFKEYDSISDHFVNIQKEQEKFKNIDVQILNQIQEMKNQTESMWKAIQGQVLSLKTTQDNILQEQSNFSTLNNKLTSMEDFVKEQNANSINQIEVMLSKFEDKIMKLDSKFILKSEIEDIMQSNNKQFNNIDLEIIGIKKDLQEFINKMTKLFEVMNVAMKKNY